MIVKCLIIYFFTKIKWIIRSLFNLTNINNWLIFTWDLLVLILFFKLWPFAYRKLYFNFFNFRTFFISIIISLYLTFITKITIPLKEIFFTSRKIRYGQFFTSHKCTIFIRIIYFFHFEAFWIIIWRFFWPIFKTRFFYLTCFIIIFFTIIFCKLRRITFMI